MGLGKESVAIFHGTSEGGVPVSQEKLYDYNTLMSITLSV